MATAGPYFGAVRYTQVLRVLNGPVVLTVTELASSRKGLKHQGVHINFVLHRCSARRHNPAEVQWDRGTARGGTIDSRASYWAPNRARTSRRRSLAR
jgi:hypothetical protein